MLARRDLVGIAGDVSRVFTDSDVDQLQKIVEEFSNECRDGRPNRSERTTPL